MKNSKGKLNNSETLPIYRDTLDLVCKVVHCAGTFNNKIRGPFVQRFATEGADLLSQIIEINSIPAGERASRMEKFQLALLKYKSSTRLCAELHEIPTSIMADLALKFDDIEKQLGGWKKSDKAKNASREDSPF